MATLHLPHYFAGFGAFLLGVVLTTACGSPAKPIQDRPDPLERIPTDWIDLPEAPFVAEMRKGKAVLVNRTRQAFNTVSTGCVVEEGGAVRVVGALFSMDVFDSELKPGQEVEGLLRMVNNIDWYVANEEQMGLKGVFKRCPPEARTAVTAAGHRDRHKWVAQGTKWKY
jgi:hypothetical protein